MSSTVSVTLLRSVSYLRDEFLNSDAITYSIENHTPIELYSLDKVGSKKRKM